VADETKTERDAFRRFVVAHERMVRAALSRLESNGADGEELCADVFVLAFRRFDEVSALGPAGQRAWLLRTATFLAANHGRRAATRRRLLNRLATHPDPDHKMSAEDEVVHDTEDAIGVALSQLSPLQRRVLVLRALGHDGPSIGRVLGVTAGSARKQLMTARAAFVATYTQLSAVMDPTDSREGTAS
jgi:RNA polymerase sigma factor (sigma-70 family)